MYVYANTFIGYRLGGDCYFLHNTLDNVKNCTDLFIYARKYITFLALLYVIKGKKNRDIFCNIRWHQLSFPLILDIADKNATNGQFLVTRTLRLFLVLEDGFLSRTSLFKYWVNIWTFWQFCSFIFFLWSFASPYFCINWQNFARKLARPESSCLVATLLEKLQGCKENSACFYKCIRLMDRRLIQNAREIAQSKCHTGTDPNGKKRTLGSIPPKTCTQCTISLQLPIHQCDIWTVDLSLIH